MPSSISGSLTATGSVTLAKPATDTLTQVQISGTYVASFVIEGTLDGANWVGVGAVQNDNRALVTSTITPAANSTLSYDLRSCGFSSVRARVTAYTSGAVNFFLQSGEYSPSPEITPSGAVGSTAIGVAGAVTTIAGTFSQSVTNGITAFAGGGQASATALTSMVNRVTVVATAGDSVKLPAATAGLSLTVINADAADSMNVFPNTGDAINALSANAAYAVAANKTATFYCAVAGTWNSNLTA